MRLIDAIVHNGRGVWTKDNQSIVLFGELSSVCWWTPRGMYEVDISDIRSIDYRPDRPNEIRYILLDLTITNNKKGTIRIESFIAENMPAALEWIKRKRENYLEEDFKDRRYTVRRWLEI